MVDETPKMEGRLIRRIGDAFPFVLTELLVVLDDDLVIRELVDAVWTDVVSFLVALEADPLQLRGSPVSPPNSIGC